MNKKSKLIISIVVILSFIISFVDGFVKPQYFTKSILKVILFLGVPLIYFSKFKDDQRFIKNLFKVKKSSILKPLILAISIYVFIVGGYFLTNSFIDFSNITIKLSENVGVNKNNFLYVSLYIAFINSLLEEFFFRGFAFMTLKNHTGKLTAYIFSSIMFSLYHTGITSEWFNISLFLLQLLGLFIGGCIFDYLNEKFGSIYPSWLVHMFANFGINTVGFILFGIL